MSLDVSSILRRTSYVTVNNQASVLTCCYINPHLYLLFWLFQPQRAHTLTHFISIITNHGLTSASPFVLWWIMVWLHPNMHIPRYRGKQTMLKWKDIRNVVMVSTFYVDSLFTWTWKWLLCKRLLLWQTTIKTGGVNQGDSQLHNYQAVRNKLKRYCQNIFCHLLDVATTLLFLFLLSTST